MQPAKQSGYLIRQAHLLSQDATLGEISGADILVSDGVIEAVGTNLDPGSAEVIDARRMIAIPGFVATHEHLWACLLGGVASDEPGRDAWTLKERLGPHLTDDDTETSVRLAAAQAIDSGVTTVLSWGHNWTGPGEADANMRGLLSSGIRARYAPGAPSTKWGLSLAQMAEIMANVGRGPDDPMDVDDLARIKRDWFDTNAQHMVSLGVSVRGPSRSSEATCRAEWAACRDLGVPIYMHCAGTRVEVDRIDQIVELDRMGLLGPDLALAHGNFLTPRDRELMAANGVNVSVTPVSELRLELGMPQISELRDQGLVVALGFDSPAYARSFDMFVTMRVGLGVERTRQERIDALSPADVLGMATLGGARYLGLESVTGSITPGKRADIVLVRRDDLNMSPAGDPLTAIVYAAQPRNVDTVMVDGRILKRNGLLSQVDETQLVADANASLRSLCERAGAAELLS